MKKLPFLFILSLLFLSLSCKDDDNEIYFDADYLSQTKWEGTYLEYTENVGFQKASIGIIFYTDSTGELSYQWENGNYPVHHNFTYSVDGKIMTIKDGYGITGKWLLTELGTNNMTLERGTGGEGADKGVLTLTRIW